MRDKDELTNCKHCDAYIDLAFGADEPAMHADATGDQDDPRSPGDVDDVCDQCYYGKGLR